MLAHKYFWDYLNNKIINILLLLTFSYQIMRCKKSLFSSSVDQSNVPSRFLWSCLLLCSETSEIPLASRIQPKLILSSNYDLALAYIICNFYLRSQNLLACPKISDASLQISSPVCGHSLFIYSDKEKTLVLKTIWLLFFMSPFILRNPFPTLNQICFIINANHP